MSLTLVCILLLAGCGGLHAASPRQGPAPVAAARRTVAPGVTIGGRAVGGLDAAATHAVLKLLASEVDVPARDAYIDPATQGAVPGIDGVALDVQATWQRLWQARGGTAVTPVLVRVPPAVGLAALPPRPIYHASRHRYAVAFVINVAWGGEYLPSMLATLARLHAAATFCLVGRWAEQHSADVHAIVASARQATDPVSFCNHGYTDHDWLGLTQSQAATSIARADRVIAALTGTKPLYFSPHKGEFNEAVLQASREEGHALILWSLDTIDWRKDATAERILNRVLGRIQGGDIVLMHPTAPTAEALEALVTGVRAKGLRLVTLDALLSPNGG